jgi:hypothetical protein
MPDHNYKKQTKSEEMTTCNSLFQNSAVSMKTAGVDIQYDDYNPEPLLYQIIFHFQNWKNHMKQLIAFQ